MFKIERDTKNWTGQTIARNLTLEQAKDRISEFKELNGYEYSEFETQGGYLGFRVKNSNSPKFFYIIKE